MVFLVHQAIEPVFIFFLFSTTFSFAVCGELMFFFKFSIQLGLMKCEPTNSQILFQLFTENDITFKSHHQTS